MNIIIQGAPIAKKRPRFVRRGKFVGTYNPQETEEGRWLLEAKGQVAEKLEGPIEMIINFFMPIPKSTSKKKTNEMASGLIDHIKKPDLDNLIKFAKDCLNGVAWRDDSQVVAIRAIKKYSREPRTEIFLKEF